MKRDFTGLVGLLVIAGVLLALVFLGLRVMRSKDPIDDLSSSTQKKEEPAKPGSYEAVFLDNGQVYFGKLEHADEPTVTLSDVYYFDTNQKTTATGAAPKMSLIRLGGEAYGPMNVMRINRDHIVLTETLRSDSQIIKAIESNAQQAL